jgi:hypothetical protein
VPEPTPEILGRLEPPANGQWLNLADDRRTVLLHAGPITDPVSSLGTEGWEKFELVSTPRALADAGGLGGPRAGFTWSPRARFRGRGGDHRWSAPDRLVAFGGGRVIDWRRRSPRSGAGRWRRFRPRSPVPR